MRRRDGEPERQDKAAVSVRLPPGEDLPLQLSASLFVQLSGGTREWCAVHVLPEEALRSWQTKRLHARPGLNALEAGAAEKVANLARVMS